MLPYFVCICALCVMAQWEEEGSLVLLLMKEYLSYSILLIYKI